MDDPDGLGPCTMGWAYGLALYCTVQACGLLGPGPWALGPEPM